MSSVVDLDSLTPEQLDELATRASGKAGERAIEPTKREVTIDGVAVTVDMRKVKDYRTLSLISAVDGGDTLAAVRLFEFILGDQRDKVVKALTDDTDYCDAERVMAFCSKLMERVGAKN